MAKVIVFGNRDLAQLAKFYLEKDAGHEVVAFTVDSAYVSSSMFEGRPVIAFEEIVNKFDPSEYNMFVPMTHSRMGRLRVEKYLRAKELGYRFISYISSRATFWKEVTLIGENCFIFEDNTIQPYSQIGNNVVLWSGNHIGHHSIISDHCFITSHAVISGHVNVGKNCFLGVNSTIRDNVVLGEGTLVGMGAVVTRDTDPWGVYTGAPAKKQDMSSLEMKI